MAVAVPTDVFHDFTSENYGIMLLSSTSFLLLYVIMVNFHRIIST